MAEKRGFEPPHPVTDLLAFQASPFSHLGTSPLILAGPERFELSVSESESDALTTWPWPKVKCMVRLMGFEPTRPRTLPPEDSASAVSPQPQYI